MKGAKDLFDSERGVFCLVLIVAVTALAIAKIITGQQWLTFAQLVLVTLVSSKTLTGALETWTGRGDAQPVPPPTASS